ncbi:LuxR C-terminal-related transcriptional regulator [Streptomyces sp. NPDC048301]|uniref:LuxR C-terminal-related transcriptional regulator n=1 Tax=Streptomyces sp. NPDC048301 TaxID=3155631 RepID=UPI003417AD6C
MIEQRRVRPESSSTTHAASGTDRQPIRTDRPRHTDAPTGITPDPGNAETRRIIQLLISGMSDERIASEMSLSTRTVQRRVHRLMEQHDCVSRFSLGFHIGRSLVTAV